MPSSPSPPPRTALAILIGLSVCHLLNDTLQSLLPAIYPIVKTTFNLGFWQIGLITFTNQIIASILQPVVGFTTDRRPQPYSLALGMCITLAGLVVLSTAAHFWALLVAAALVGVGSAIFHPESSRLARVASGGRHGFAQSLFQTGGNLGSSLGPLLAALVVEPRGQGSIAWFAILAIVAIVMLVRIGRWYVEHRRVTRTQPHAHAPHHGLSPRQVRKAIAILLALIFSKYIYLASVGSYYTFFLIERFGVSVQSAQLHLFVFLGAVAAGTFIGGPIGDRFGRKYVIWGSILGVLPFTLALPYVSLFWTSVLSVAIGLILASAFSAILVYAQELLPGRVGLVAGLFFGFAFGVGGLGAAGLGRLADITGIVLVYRACAFLPIIGLLTHWLPNIDSGRHRAEVIARRV